MPSHRELVDELARRIAEAQLLPGARRRQRFAEPPAEALAPARRRLNKAAWAGPEGGSPD